MSYRKSVRDLAAALCAEARAFGQRNGKAAPLPLGVSSEELEDYFLTVTEQALEAIPNDVLIAILGGRMRGRLEQAGFAMDKILPLETDGGPEPKAMTSGRVYRLRA